MKIIATYALCGFSNFASVGIQIGTLTALGADRSIVSSQGLRALTSATIGMLQQSFVVNND